jgi:hypothetical protein
MSNQQAHTSAREARARVQEEEQAVTNQGVATGNIVINNEQSRTSAREARVQEEEDEEEEEQHRRKRAREDTREWFVLPIGEAARDKHFSRLKDWLRLTT